MTIKPADGEHQTLPDDEREKRKHGQKRPQMAQRSSRMQVPRRGNVPDREERHEDNAKVPDHVLEVARLGRYLKTSNMSEFKLK